LTQVRLSRPWQLKTLTGPGVLATELDRLRIHDNSMRFHAGTGCITPETSTAA